MKRLILALAAGALSLDALGEVGTAFIGVLEVFPSVLAAHVPLPVRACLPVYLCLNVCT